MSMFSEQSFFVFVFVFVMFVVTFIIRDFNFLEKWHVATLHSFHITMAAVIAYDTVQPASADWDLLGSHWDFTKQRGQAFKGSFNIPLSTLCALLIGFPALADGNALGLDWCRLFILKGLWLT